MSEFKGTKGNIVYKEPIDNWFDIETENTLNVLRSEELGHDQLQANANLIVDAFKVRQQINCELSELLDFMNLMITEKRRMIHPALCIEIEQLIKKVKDNEETN